MMLLSFNRKSIGNWKQILINWRGIFYRKSKFWNHLSLTGFSELSIYKSLSFDNLSLDLHDVWIFWLECDISGTVSLYIAQISLKLGDQPWRYGHTLVQNCNLKLQTFYNILGGRSVPYLCNLPHISLSFTQNGMKISYRLFVPFRAGCILKNDPRCFVLNGKF